jgi:hypothetical protein
MVVALGCILLLVLGLTWGVVSLLIERSRTRGLIQAMKNGADPNKILPLLLPRGEHNQGVNEK